MTSTPQALVTGASGGIGGAVARRLAAAGYDLWLSGRDEARLAECGARVRQLGRAAHLVPADLGSPEGIEAALATIGEARLDVVVHSLGVFHRGPVAETPLEILDHQLAVNLRAPWELTRRLDPVGRGVRDLVFVSTTAVLGPGAGTGAYTASKAGLGALAATLRDELADDGVRVLTLFPGRTASAMQEEVRAAEGQPYDPDDFMDPDDVAAMVVAAVTLPRSAEVTEIVLRHRRPGAPR